MAERKGPRIVPPEGRKSGKEMSEKSPNPHGESNILEMPIRTQQRKESSGKNVPKVPNMVGGNLNPSVGHDFEKRVVSPKMRRIKINGRALPSRSAKLSAKTPEQKAETQRNRGNEGLDFETCSSASSFPPCFKGFQCRLLDYGRCRPPSPKQNPCRQRPLKQCWSALPTVCVG